jgi:hypothetical protein
LFVLLSGSPSFAASKANCQTRTDTCMHNCGTHGGSPTTVGHCEYKCDAARTSCMKTATGRKAQTSGGTKVTGKNTSKDTAAGNTNPQTKGPTNERRHGGGGARH